jgi:ABC-type uncharacterized transport system involved in gliding motility auxiliary subunit
MSEKLSGVLGWVGIALVLGALVVRFTMPEQEAVWYWSAVAGIVVVGLYILTQWRDIFGAFGPRRMKYGALATSSVILGLGILTAVNFVLARQNKRWDLTAAGQYSLSDQTVQVLRSLDAPIRIIVFGRDIEFPVYQDRLAEYEYTSPQVSLEFVDVDKEPLQARQYEIQSYGTIIFEYEGRVERVVSDTEQELTNALIKVIEGEEVKAYFVQGHGERSPEGTDRDGLSALSESLRLDNFSVDTVVLAQTDSVPADASVIILAGPTIDYLPSEIELLRDYLDAGGKALFLLDPPNDPETDQAALLSLAAEWGISVGDDVVIDSSGVGQLLGADVTVPVAATYPPHPITENFALLTAFPLARSVRPESVGTTGRVAQTFIETSERSWAETDMAELASGEVAPGGDDTEGPISIGAALSVAVARDVPSGDPADDEIADEDEPTLETRVAVIGDSDFATNGVLGIQGNRDLALNTINWLAQQENLISIRPRQPEDRRITLTADQQWRVQVMTLFMIPGVVIGLGLLTWYRRR